MRYNVLILINRYHRLTIPCDHVIDALHVLPQLIHIEEDDTIVFKPMLDGNNHILMFDEEGDGTLI